MPTLSFEGETHAEIVRKVRRWLASIEGTDQNEHLTVVEAVDAASEVTKDALGVIARAAPGPVARSELFKALTRMGYEATESTKRAVVAGLERIEEATGGEVRRLERARNSVAYEMNAAVARQIVKSLKP